MSGLSKAEKEARNEQFVRVYAVTGNATQAAHSAGYAESNAKQKGVEYLADPTFGPRAREARKQYLDEQAQKIEAQKAVLIDAAGEAIETLREVAQAAPRLDEGKPDKAHHHAALARVAAAVAILDRAGHKPVERVETKNEHTFQPADVDEVDSRLDRLFAARGTGKGASGDRGTTH